LRASARGPPLRTEINGRNGEDLSYFWRGYFFHNWAPDLAVDGVSYAGGDPAKGAKIALTSRGQLILPVSIRVAFKDGTTRDIALPGEAWIQSASHVVTLDSTQPIASVVIDPYHLVPERDRAAGTCTAPGLTPPLKGRG
jgi:hypothetical protein